MIRPSLVLRLVSSEETSSPEFNAANEIHGLGFDEIRDSINDVHLERFGFRISVDYFCSLFHAKILPSKVLNG